MTIHATKTYPNRSIKNILKKAVSLREPRKNFLMKSKKRRSLWASLTNKHEAEFIAWKTSVTGDHEPIYKILPPHQLHDITVNANFLLREGIEIPKTPRCPYA